MARVFRVSTRAVRELLKVHKTPFSDHSGFRGIGVEDAFGPGHHILKRATGLPIAPSVRHYRQQWGSIGWHCDKPVFNVDAGATLIIYLSQFEGGELVFRDGTVIAPTPGTAVLFDKALEHRTELITSGVKLITIADVEVDGLAISMAEEEEEVELCGFHSSVFSNAGVQGA
jgi:hypothetical protein